MVIQYPHTMIVSVTVTESTQDANGNWVPGTTATTTTKCRYETKDGNGYVTNDSGTQIAYDAIVYMPLPVDVIKIGSKVKIENNGVEITTQTVKHFSKGQLNARIWL